MTGIFVTAVIVFCVLIVYDLIKLLLSPLKTVAKYLFYAGLVITFMTLFASVAFIIVSKRTPMVGMIVSFACSTIPIPWMSWMCASTSISTLASPWSSWSEIFTAGIPPTGASDSSSPFTTADDKTYASGNYDDF